VFAVFVGVSVIAPLPLALTPLIVPPTTVVVQVYVVVPIVLVGVKLNAVPLQIVVCNCGAVFVITGTGFTVTITSVNVPLQPFALGVIRYVTVPLVMPSVLVKAWLMVAPLPAKAPVTLLLACTVQLKVVPLTVFGFVIATLVLFPLQMVWLLAATVGIGFTVTM
jgi:hypothetical protein